MTIKFIVKRLLLIPLLGLLVFSYGNPSTDFDANKQENNANLSQNASQSWKTDKNTPKPATVQLAFDKMVKVLHAPYKNGESFFKMFPDKDRNVEIKQSSESLQLAMESI